MPEVTEKKTDIVLDENGSAIDKDGNKKEKFQADYMSRADVMAMVTEFTQSFEQALSQLYKLEHGSSFTEAKDTVTRLITQITGGSHVAFAKKNAWIADAAQRQAFLTSGIDQGIADKQFLIDFYKLVVGTTDLRAEYLHYLELCLDAYLPVSYAAIRYEIQMREIVKSDVLYDLHDAFIEFDSIYNRYNSGDIYKEIPVSKSRYSAEENLEMVLDHMDDAICQKAHLKKFMLDARASSPTAINQLYIYDRETKQYDSFACKADNLVSAINKGNDLLSKVGDAYVIAGDGLMSYLDGYRQLIEAVIRICQSGLNAIDAFKTQKDKAPYAIMHYDAYIKDVVSKHYLGSLTDPLTEGTNYRVMAQTMVKRCQELAKTVAKLAPS